MKNSNLIKRWETLLKKNGYEIEWGKVDWWDNQMWAKKDREFFPLAYVGYKNGSAFIISANEIAVSFNNLSSLRQYYANENIDICFRQLKNKKFTFNVKYRR